MVIDKKNADYEPKTTDRYMTNIMNQGQDWMGDGYIKTKQSYSSVYSSEFVRLTLSKRNESTSSREAFFSLMSYEDVSTF